MTERKIINKKYMTGTLKACKKLFAVGFQAGFIDPGILLTNNKCTPGFTPLVVRDANYGSLGNVRVFINHLFYLYRIDILTSADIHLFLASGDVIIAFVIKAKQVACPHPAILQGFSGRFIIVPVA